MADTGSYAGAMKTRYPDTPPRVASKRGDKRPGSLKGGMPLGVHRKAAAMRLGNTKFKRQAQGAHKVPPASG